MCGIVGYIGFRSAKEVLLKSLKRLEYRGYDSAGVAIVNGKINIAKKKGYIDSLEFGFDGTLGIGHTRWATHGVPEDRNAHPFLDCKGDIAIVHNGIIENYMVLKEELVNRGHKFTSDTDSEVIAHLIEEYYQGDFKEAFLKAVRELKGSFAIVAINKNERKIMAAKKDSPLVIGVGDHENFVASDIPAFLEYTNRVIVMKDGEISELTDDIVHFYDFNGRNIEKKNVEIINWSIEDAEKSGYPHFMLKEIFEQPRALDSTLHSLLSRNDMDFDFERVTIVACGTSYHAGLVGKYLIEELLQIPVDVYYASEYRYRPDVVEDSLAIFITQSGETADTIAAARKAKVSGNETLAITNVVGSSITSYVDRVLYTNAGPEIGVAATKTFTAQLLALEYFAIRAGESMGKLSVSQVRNFINSLRKIPLYVENTLNLNDIIEKEAKKIYKNKDMFFIGRSMNYPIALEGALKMKEISYIHAEGYPAGELKHGPLALIEEGIPVIALVPEDITYDKMLSNIKEVSARNAYVIGVSSNMDVGKYVDTLIKVPETELYLSPFVNVVVLQLLAYHAARLLGRDIDKPRNLAKSVTVE
ncbi:glutamine--fructose-6-phosphate transaminase (isomerizing) [Candidatus Aciduliprofundum boonei]|uniref:Glutamine--fructose-6-phosphate aminotransferase [isomerizing] n=1 Tax=Aciduliprofundum boonei (strain DSM 19572 / T469) TaxID=439481 RepID=B5IDM3_ACIB4|nr:glutamine--fructose-6-phosphate transaminase (isomerizing) [Candidatus Aciduliprofundum boonei]ADD08095.1 glucosamine/fructose-6-phosphate aminotransferase, isomerizing [Aciduliprofundum boonei T469]EDY35580.1 glucosamine--fructose-6-phosphate aminotransferase, isomerizing [Aciduliprofundum boonei T469]HII55531.1 glutamine--fructose-6-phosphate transaminase (isomerizing) [Candidatus Aciduliprofundum boonei]